MIKITIYLDHIVGEIFDLSGLRYFFSKPLSSHFSISRVLNTLSMFLWLSFSNVTFWSLSGVMDSGVVGVACGVVFLSLDGPPNKYSSSGGGISIICLF